MIQASFEVPLPLLKESIQFNDFEFSLVHLYESHPEYKQFYIDCVQAGRLVIMDNSAYELNGSVDIGILIDAYDETKPTYVVAPDYIDDMNRTLKATMEFMINLAPEKNSVVIPVVQGSNFAEYKRCYKEYASWGVFEYIAIPFSIKGCVFEHEPQTQALKWGFSRNALLDEMVRENIIRPDIKHHLLGCGDPMEFRYYRGDSKYDFITSVDTSCPVMLAMFGEELNRLIGLGKEKRKEKLADNLDFVFRGDSKALLYDNIEVFRKYYL